MVIHDALRERQTEPCALVVLARISPHLSEVLATLQRAPARMVLRAAYQADRPSQWLAEHTRINAVTLPFTVGGTEGAKDLFGLFDDTIARLLKGNT